MAELMCGDLRSLGNHEFDESVDGLIPFIRNISAPVLAANLILDKVPQLKAETNLKKSIVIIINRVSIGIIGYLTPDTRFLAPQTDVEYEDEVIAIKREVAILQDRGVKILIALGHSGVLEDLKIAKEVGGIDLVIGGHSNTFLSNDRYFTEKPEIQQGPYPTLVEQASGKIVPVVQAYAYTKYMGRLHVIFDSNGEIIEVDGEPILLNQSIPQDPEVDKLVKIYHEKMDYINNEVVGTSLDFLNGETCRLRECNIGSFITDATLKYSKENNICTNIAIIQGGRIRSSITRQVKPFQMTKGDWYTVLPFTDPLSIITMNGTLLRKALEHSVDTWRNVDSTGQFLQFSGMQVVYDLAKPPGSRIISAKAHGTIDKSSCEESPLVDIQDNMIYKVIMSSFLALGGDGYEIFQELPVEVQVFSEIVAIFDYIDKYGPLDPALTGRLTVLNEDEVQITKDNFLSSSISTEQILSYSSSVSIRSSVLVISFGILPFIVIS